LAPWRKSLAMHNPAKIVTDLVVTLGLGENRLADIAVLRRRAGSVGAGEVGSDGVAHDQRAAAGAGRDQCQGVETTGPVSAGPPVQRVAGLGVLPAERAGIGMGAVGDRPHDHAARLGRQPRVPAQDRSTGSGTTPPAAPADGA
jgi:hypothetical protein